MFVALTNTVGKVNYTICKGDYVKAIDISLQVNFD